MMLFHEDGKDCDEMPCRREREFKFCTRPEGHEGNHEAWGIDSETPVAVWDNNDELLFSRKELLG